MDDLKIAYTQPSADAFRALRASVGWNSPPNDTTLTASLANSLFHISIYKHLDLVGFGRVIGDGHMFFYIQDVIVSPDYQQQGIGRLIMQHIENYLNDAAGEGATMGLFAAKGKESLYTDFGYVLRDGQSLGFGMCKFK